VSSPVQQAGTILFVGVSTLFAIWAIGEFMAGQQKETAAAVAKGFADAEQMKLATSKGFMDGASWRANMTEQAALQAEAQAKAKRQWDADAPKRAAQAEENRKRTLAEAEERQPPALRMTLTNQSWSTGGFDTIGMMSFTIKNENPYDVKDFVLSCSFYAASGTALGDRSHVLYESVKAKGSRAFQKVNIGFIPNQSSRGGCSLIAASRK
jgi:hypothetical protein